MTRRQMFDYISFMGRHDVELQQTTVECLFIKYRIMSKYA